MQYLFSFILIVLFNPFNQTDSYGMSQIKVRTIPLSILRVERVNWHRKL